MAILEKTLQKYRIFVREYLVDGNGTRAATAAGYAAPTAHVTASKLLKNAKVQELLSEARSIVEQKAEDRAQQVRDEMHNLAFYDLRVLFDENDALKPINQLTFEEQKLITKIKSKEIWETNDDGDLEHIGNMVEVGLLDRRGMLQDNAKLHGLFVAKLEIHDSRNLGAEMLEAQKRAELAGAPVLTGGELSA